MVAFAKPHRKVHTPYRSAKDSGHRYYSAEISRWLSRDPIGERSSVNLFRFVRNGAPNRRDSLGLADEEVDWLARVVQCKAWAAILVAVDPYKTSIHKCNTKTPRKHTFYAEPAGECLYCTRFGQTAHRSEVVSATECKHRITINVCQVSPWSQTQFFNVFSHELQHYVDECEMDFCQGDVQQSCEILACMELRAYVAEGLCDNIDQCWNLFTGVTSGGPDHWHAWQDIDGHPCKDKNESTIKAAMVAGCYLGGENQPEQPILPGTSSAPLTVPPNLLDENE